MRGLFRGKKKDGKLLAQQEKKFEQQLFPGVKERKKAKQKRHNKEPLLHGGSGETAAGVEEQIELQRQNEKALTRSNAVASDRKRQRSSPEKERQLPGVVWENLYDTRDSYPIIEYLPSEEESESASLTPSFVLELTWPRIIQFYHPSSPHCRSLKPIYVAVARGIKRRSSRLPVEFHALNCGIHRDVCEQTFNIQSVPTFLGLRSGAIEGNVISLPGNMEGAYDSKAYMEKDVALKVDHIANAMGIALDAVKKGHTGAAFANSALDANNAVVDSFAESNFPGSETSYESSIPVAEQVFHDAKASFVTVLTSSLYSQYPHEDALPPEVSRTLSEFIDLIRWAFPPETEVHGIAADIASDFGRVSTSEDELLKVIGKHVDLGSDVSWSSRCGAQTNGGFACGIWSFLHVLSIGVAERHTSVIGDDSEVDVNSAGMLMRSFINLFFIGCPSCRDLWIELFDERCRLHSTDHSVGGKDGRDDWRGLSICLWQVHNEITIRRQRAAGKGHFRKQMRIASNLWPSKEDCPTCWQGLTDDTGQLMSMDSFDRGEVYNHLKKIYWPDGVHNNRLIVLHRWSRAKRALSLKRLRARVADHKWSTPVLILHLLVGYLILRTLIPWWRVHMRRVRRRVLKDRRRHSSNATVSDKTQRNRHPLPPHHTANRVSGTHYRHRAQRGQRRHSGHRTEQQHFNYFLEL